MITPCLSVFIVNYNTRSLLERCLQSIYRTRGDLTIEVFVADNDSADGSADMVQSLFPDVLLTRHSKNIGFTRGINSLLPLARGKYYLLVHPDIELLPHTLKRLVNFLESNPEAGIVGGDLYFPDGTPNQCEVLWPGFRNDLLCFAVRLFEKLPGVNGVLQNHNPMGWSHKSTSRVNSVWNACMMVRRVVFETIGYFDEDFFYAAADWDLCKRAADAGWSVYYLHLARAIHYERQSFAKKEIFPEEVRYKVDGWYSAAWQMRDRYVFLRKHSSVLGIYGVKTIYVLENVLRVWLIIGRLLFRGITFREARFQISACLQTIEVIFRA